MSCSRCLVAFLIVFGVEGQELTEQQAPQQTAAPAAASQTPVNQDKPPANAAGQSKDRSVLKPKPAGEAIKPKDYSDASGYWHPFSRMPKYVLMDQKAIWTSP